MAVAVHPALAVAIAAAAGNFWALPESRVATCPPTAAAAEAAPAAPADAASKPGMAAARLSDGPSILSSDLFSSTVGACLAPVVTKQTKR